MNAQQTTQGVEITPPSVMITPDRRSKTKKVGSKKKLDVVIDTPVPVMVTELEKPKAFNAKQQGLIDALSISEADMKGQTTRREIARERCLGIEHDSSFAEWANSLRDGLKNSGYTQGSADVIRSEYMVLRLACRYNKEAMTQQFDKQQKFADLIKFAREVKDAHAKEQQAKAQGKSGQAANDAVISPTKPQAPAKPEAKFMKEKGFESRLDKIATSVEEMNGKVDLHHLSRATEVLLDQVDAVLAQVVSITGSKYQDEYEDICAETEELKGRIRKLIEKAEKAKIEAVEAKSTKQI